MMIFALRRRQRLQQIAAFEEAPRFEVAFTTARDSGPRKVRWDDPEDVFRTPKTVSESQSLASQNSESSDRRLVEIADSMRRLEAREFAYEEPFPRYIKKDSILANLSSGSMKWMGVSKWYSGV